MPRRPRRREQVTVSPIDVGPVGKPCRCTPRSPGWACPACRRSPAGRHQSPSAAPAGGDPELNRQRPGVLRPGALLCPASPGPRVFHPVGDAPLRDAEEGLSDDGPADLARPALPFHERDGDLDRRWSWGASTVTVLAGTTAQQSVTLGAANPVVNFSVDGSPVTPRRTVVQLSNCNNCHVALSEHGGLRNNTQYCVLCHNPSNTDASTRSTAVAPYNTQPAQGINFNLLVHRLHDGVNAATDNPKNPYIVVGHGGSISNFTGVLFPAMSATGQATYMQDCSLCHVKSSEQNNLSITGLNAVTDPQGWINPVQPVSSACSGCHVSEPEAAHFLANTTSLGETCVTCHGTGGAFAVDAVHAQ